MKIPIQNIYYLLVYAWDSLEEADLLQIEPEQSTDLLDLFANVLSSGVAHILRRGLDRGGDSWNSRKAQCVRDGEACAPTIGTRVVRV
jgi:5-methylcytosine-specific restriction endonuclease McrBC regulatory subunit McrC